VLIRCSRVGRTDIVLGELVVRDEGVEVGVPHAINDSGRYLRFEYILSVIVGDCRGFLGLTYIVLGQLVGRDEGVEVGVPHAPQHAVHLAVRRVRDGLPKRRKVRQLQHL
jgi:hypothetical protein